ncbi:MAG: ribonuclease E/G [Pseudomonadota bacterium]
MRARILIEAGVAETRACLIEDESVTELRRLPAAGDAPDAFEYGTLYCGRVRAVSRSPSGAFIDIGGAVPAFLPLNGKRKLQEGARLIVQIAAEAYGEKGARVTDRPVLPSARTAFAPGGEGLGTSRRLQGAAKDRALRVLSEAVARAGAGAAGRWSARTDGAADDVDQDIEALSGRWRGIQLAAETASIGDRLGPPLGPEDAIMRDWLPLALSADEAEIVVDGAAPGACLGDAGLPLRRHSGRVPLLEAEGAEAAWDDAIAEALALSGGASLKIAETEAATLIDVDAGGAPAAAANREAATAAARWARLRGIGGQVIVDFVGDRRSIQRAEVRRAFEAAATLDPAGIEIGGFTRLGLFEAIRPRSRRSWLQALTEPAGAGPVLGRRLTMDAVAKTALRALERALRAEPAARLRLDLGEAAAHYFEERPAWTARLAERYGRRFEIAAAAGRGRESFDVSPF